MARRRDGIQKAPRASPIVAELGPRLRSGEIVLLDALHVIQDRRGYLPRRDLEALADVSRIPLANEHRAASFYPHFRLPAPAPKVCARVCGRLPCHRAGSGRLPAVLEERCREDPGLEV